MCSGQLIFSSRYNVEMRYSKPSSTCTCAQDLPKLKAVLNYDKMTRKEQTVAGGSEQSTQCLVQAHRSVHLNMSAQKSDVNRKISGISKLQGDDGTRCMNWKMVEHEMYD